MKFRYFCGDVASEYSGTTTSTVTAPVVPTTPTRRRRPVAVPAGAGSGPVRILAKLINVVREQGVLH